MAGGSRRKAVNRGTLRRVAGNFRPYRAQVVLVCAIVLVSAALGVVTPLLIEATFDRALFVEGGPNLPLLYRLVGAMAAIPLVTGALGIWQTLLANRIGQHVMRDLRDRLFTHLQSMPLRFFTGTRTGEIQSRLANDVGGVQTVVTQTASSILSSGVTFVSTIVAMVLISWQLTLVAVGTIPVFILLTRWVGQRRRAVSSRTQKSMAEMSAVTEETLSVSGILLSKVFGRQEGEAARYRAENQRLADLQVRQQIIGGSFFTVVQAFFGITPALAYLLAGVLLSGGGGAGAGAGISAGTVVAFTTLQSRLFFPIGNLLQTVVELSSSLALFERIYEYLDLEPHIVESPDAVTLPKQAVRGRIAFDRVRFAYDEDPPGAVALDGAAAGEGPPDRRWALDDVSFEIEPGQLAAFVGPSGAGKTTISYLVPRLYDVTEGAVTIDGTDVRKIAQASLADAIGFVTQESYLFHSTVADNIRYGRPDATQEEVEQAARMAAIHDRIAELPGGYETMVGERGYRMSGGEKQRLAIARVLLHDPRILILDEATSALDTTSERLVQAALEPLTSGRTTLAIAHRLSTIVAADVIFVIDRGRIVERGTHAELLRAGGLYAQLHSEQYQGGLVEARCSDGVVLSSGDVLHEPTPSTTATTSASTEAAAA